MSSLQWNDCNQIRIEKITTENTKLNHINSKQNCKEYKSSKLKITPKIVRERENFLCVEKQKIMHGMIEKTTNLQQVVKNKKSQK